MAWGKIIVPSLLVLAGASVVDQFCDSILPAYFHQNILPGLRSMDWGMINVSFLWVLAGPTVVLLYDSIMQAYNHQNSLPVSRSMDRGKRIVSFLWVLAGAAEVVQFWYSFLRAYVHQNILPVLRSMDLKIVVQSLWVVAAAAVVVLACSGIRFLQKVLVALAARLVASFDKERVQSADFSSPPIANPPRNPRPGITEEVEPRVKRLNGSVYELYVPTDDDENPIPPEMEIIFFHGLQLGDFEQAYWKTWLGDCKKQVIWPQDWLTMVLPKARILSVTYNSSAIHIDGQNDVHELGSCMVDDVILDHHHIIGQQCPVFLVGHSLGGLVIKQFILSAITRANLLFPDDKDEDFEKINRFLENLKGVFYYATPHGGSKIADLITKFPVMFDSPILHHLKTLYAQSGRINEEFRQHRTNRNIRAFAMAESLSTSYKGFSSIVVEEASARHDVDDFYTHTEANHFTVCKAKRNCDPVVIGKLVQFISDALRELGQEGSSVFERRVLEDAELNDDNRGIHQLNDSVWEFYSPSGLYEMEIIFFHGLPEDDRLGQYKHAYWTTWLSNTKDKNSQVNWPKAWLSTVFPKARILSISYNSSVKEVAGQPDMYLLGENLVSNIIRDTNYDIGQNCPVFLVGHCVGGIVIQQFILSAFAKKTLLHPTNYRRDISRIETFLKNLRGVFYFGTPHGGSEMIGKARRKNATLKGPIHELLDTLYKQKSTIHEEFNRHFKKLNAKAIAVAEGKKTKYLNTTTIIVPKRSAFFGVDNAKNYVYAGADHFSVCRAERQINSVVIGKLTAFIKEATPGRTHSSSVAHSLTSQIEALHGVNRY